MKIHELIYNQKTILLGEHVHEYIYNIYNSYIIKYESPIHTFFFITATTILLLLALIKFFARSYLCKYCWINGVLILGKILNFGFCA